MSASILHNLDQLRASAGKALEILTNQSDVAFQDRAKRWTDIDRKTPAAIILPASEEEIQKTVQWAVETSVPFVIKSGGHSEWSTIDGSGVIIDLSKYAGVEVDARAQTAILRGSILSKEVAVALADAGLFAAVGNGNPIGAIPYFLGGGVAIATSITGYGSDQVISARMIDAKGNILEVTEEKEPDLLFALRGAGQFFGLVTQLVIKAHPLAALGNDQGVIWLGSFVFPLERADEVAKVMKVLMDDSSHATAGLLMIMSPPPQRQPILLVSARYTGNPDDAKVAYGPLYDLQPLAAQGGPVPIQNANDGHEAYNAPGTFKRFGVVGLRRFDGEAFSKVIKVWKKLVAECPDAADTSFNFQWESRPAKQPDFESANSLHDIRYWQNNFIWHTDAASRGKVDEFNDKSIEIMRGPDRSEYADFQNGTRTGPIELRFRGDRKLEKLKELKKKWDPTGVFTTQLLD
ncbi:FAD-binding domain-containing protein [Melanomma pulvis-pyrius CBS 109.77]|uniref:FAD-binding domain-containing protein n=1 Tax=Melanomma pulvis-pyrius CBS 109.77 TaxID=1314802 RepID=A0A6A6WUV0_9PLEO|nr:FAD-binding domain-containing protein [Melanomma pulvis-pyrius CBS 109.77]